MEIKILVDKTDFRQFLHNIKLVAKNGIEIKIQCKKIRGKSNYLLIFTCNGKRISCAKSLSEMRISAENVFNENGIKFRVINDESLVFLASSLYPLACEFESKLRSFIYMVIFDIDEQANLLAVERFKKTFAQKDNDKDIEFLPQDDFLTKSDLGHMLDFLFDNNDFIKEVKNILSPKDSSYDRRMSKEDLINRIENLKDTSLWEALFKPLFPNSVIPKLYNEIHDYRNRIMHVREIDYTNYDHIRFVYKKVLKDLDKNMTTGLVADESKSNISLLANSFVNYIIIRKELINVSNTLRMLFASPAAREFLGDLSEDEECMTGLLKTIYYSTMSHTLTSGIKQQLENLQRSIVDREEYSDLMRELQFLKENYSNQNTHVDDSQNNDGDASDDE